MARLSKVSLHHFQSMDRNNPWISQARLVSFRVGVTDPELDSSFLPDWIDFEKTALNVAKSYQIDIEEINKNLKSTISWLESAHEGCVTLFSIGRFVKGLCLVSNNIENDNSFMKSIWIPIVVKELLSPIGGIVDDYSRAEFNEMVSDDSDLMLEWERLWKEIRYAEGETILTRCVIEAKKMPQPFHPSPKYNIFLNFANCLQTMLGDGEILLPQKKVGQLFGISQSIVSSFTKRALREGFLVKVEKESFNHRKAARYRFVKAGLSEDSLNTH